MRLISILGAYGLTVNNETIHTAIFVVNACFLYGIPTSYEDP